MNNNMNNSNNKSKKLSVDTLQLDDLSGSEDYIHRSSRLNSSKRFEGIKYNARDYNSGRFNCFSIKYK